MESVSDVIRRNGKCPLKNDIEGTLVRDCLLVLGPGCAEYEGPCNYRDEELSRIIQYALGD